MVDTHHHLWDLGRLSYDWLVEPGWAGQTALLGDYKMIRTSIGSPKRLFREFYGANVIKTVHVEAAYSGADPVDETIWLEAVARAFGYPNGLVVYCDLERSDAEHQIARHLEASSLTRGVRMRVHPDSARGLFRRNLMALPRYDLSYELTASPGRVLADRHLASQLPDVQFIVGNSGFPTRNDKDFFAVWKDEIERLAEVPNVACKVSGLGMSDHQWTMESLRPWILHCIEVFGVERIMFGTNWPVDILYATYLEQTDVYRRVLADAGFSREEQGQMFRGNAERFYRI
jgi:predicted TIM-barrel fold metal-dependent hydrolase